MQGLVSVGAAHIACEWYRARARFCEKSFLLRVAFGEQWVHNGYMDSTREPQGGTVYELVFTNERDQRGPLHKSVSNAIEYGEAAGNDGEEWEVWQLADDDDRTRMVMIKSGVMREIDARVIAHYNPDPDDHSASRNVETLQREAPHLIASTPMTHSTIVAALIHYSLHVADPSLCAAALEEVAPRVDGLPWAPALNDARRDYRATLDRAEAGSQ